MYIKKTIAISPQNTLAPAHERSYTQHSGNKYFAIEPNYQGLIPGNILRRMGKSNRLGVAAGTLLMHDAKKELDGIVMASSNGGIQNSLKFLNQMMEYDEGTLLPTNFIQGAPNTVAGNLAILNKTNKYNTTHVQKGIAFENALLDALMYFKTTNEQSLLLGAVEEISENNHFIEERAGYFKKEDTNSNTLLQSNTIGSVNGEGAFMFLLEKEKTEQSISLLDTMSTNFINAEQALEQSLNLLQKNHLEPSDLDGLILGYSGDSRTDAFYRLHEEYFKTSNHYSFKNLCGEFSNASAFGLWLANEILLDQPIYKEAVLQIQRPKPRTLLIYNNYLGKHHGWQLVHAH